MSITKLNVSAIRNIRNQALTDAAHLAEKIERKQFDTVGNPMIKTFTPYIANAIRKMIA